MVEHPRLHPRGVAGSTRPRGLPVIPEGLTQCAPLCAGLPRIIAFLAGLLPAPLPPDAHTYRRRGCPGPRRRKQIEERREAARLTSDRCVTF